MKVLITNFDMEIGGVERSLASMLANFDYQNHQVDLHLHSHTGPLMGLIDTRANLLPENLICKTFRLGIKDLFFSGFIKIAVNRLIARLISNLYAKRTGSKNCGYFQMQTIWDKCINHVMPVNGEYDVAISYLWPHHYTAFNVNAKKKIAWIHTDYSKIEIDNQADLQVWQKFDHIASISDACTDAFLSVYPSLKDKIILVENLTNPEYVRDMAKKPMEKSFSSGFNLVSVGRLCNAKAFDRAVKVLADLHSRGYKDINWYIVGEGRDRCLIDEKIKQYGLKDNFVLLGSTINPYPYIKSADIYLQPSRYEGKAVTVTEALILCKPVIITNYATASSQISNYHNGLICDQSIEAIADEIINLYENEELRKSLIATNKKACHSNADELNKLYNVF
ncbi:TPA: glycosyltransferase [Photobacterium damselae]